MLQGIIESILELRIWIVVCIVSILATGGLLLIVTSKFEWNRGSRKIIGFLYELNNREIILLSLQLLRIFLICGFLLTGAPGGLAPVWFMLILFLATAILGRSFRLIPLNLLNSLLMTATMVVMGLLSGYLRDVYMDWRITATLVMLGVFLLLYAISDMFRCVNGMIDYRVKKRKSDEQATE